MDVIGNKAFIEFVEQLEREEDLELDTVNLDEEPVVIETIHPDPDKLDKDIQNSVLLAKITAEGAKVAEFCHTKCCSRRSRRTSRSMPEGCCGKFVRRFSIAILKRETTVHRCTVENSG